MHLIILAAGRGSRLPKKLRSKPKCLSIINKKTILNHNINFFKKFKKKTIVGGYKSNLLKSFSKKNGFKLIINNDYRKTNMVYSLFLTSKYVNEDVIVCYGDIIFNPSIYKLLLKKENLMPINSNWLKTWKKRMPFEEIKKDAENIKISKNIIISIGKKIKNKMPKYQYMGLFKLEKNTFFILEKYFRKINNKKIDMTTFLNFSIINKNLKFKIKKYKNYWYEIDNEKDLNLASKELG
ncbi:NTP transferase domain-containing protein [Candidatus Pelagibacter sp.]|nr:NTP transferase domain-containing protein [Candidatus Pelagibacter sp.]